MTFQAQKYVKNVKSRKNICTYQNIFVLLRPKLCIDKKNRDMTRTTFNRLREVKDSLPHGSMDAIAAELGIASDEVRAFFNGTGSAESSYHMEPGPDGGIVVLNDTRILEVALRRAWEKTNAI